MRMGRNVLGGELMPCCSDPPTGFYRDGFCRTGRDDVGLHTVCARMTREFLPGPQARGPLVRLRAPLEGGPEGRQGPARHPGVHALLRPGVRLPGGAALPLRVDAGHPVDGSDRSGNLLLLIENCLLIQRIENLIA